MMSGIAKRAENAIDPNTKQNAASDPLESIWVSASAGTGKTKVLTDRVLRLMLPREDGAPATPPHKILCLTFTKAGASEMAQRINAVLGAWSVLPRENAAEPEKSLSAELAKLFGKPATQEQSAAAQRLFAQVMDCPGGLQIMTIHSFCTSVLGRFPLEAGLSPHFKGLDEDDAKELMQQAQMQVLHEVRTQKGTDLVCALENLSGEIGEDVFANLLRGLAAERYQLQGILRKFWDVQGIYTEICRVYGIVPQQDDGAYLRGACADGAFAADDLLRAAEAMNCGKGKDETLYAPVIAAWVRGDVSHRIAHYASYSRAFFTAKGDMRAKPIANAPTIKMFPECGEILITEMQRLSMVNEMMARSKSASLTRDLLLIGVEILKRYEAIKQERGALDFNDMIIRTLELLRGQSGGFAGLEAGDQDKIPAWVMYKMDQGLDHILIDEAQDTNPEQWQIISALCDEFFSGDGARDNVLRTVFTVGDIKQSIYGFQRAAPEEFKRMQGVMGARIADAGLASSRVDLDISFRSTQDVLDVVDDVFAQEAARIAVGEENIRHISFRKQAAGLVELWPLCEAEKAEKGDKWDLPTQIKEQKSAAAQLAKHIAEKIDFWIKSKEILPAYGRPIEAGDIMILMRTRSKLVDMLVRELKLRKVAVSGVDRMVLGDQLAVQDVLAMAQFCLLPEDDLTLASVLKSPFLGWDEDEIFSLAYGRKTTLWAELQYFDGQRLEKISDAPENFVIVSPEKRDAARAYLSQLINEARSFGVYDFLCGVLQKPCPADAISGMRAMQARLGADALDPIDEVLNAALSYARKHVDNLQLFIEWLERQNIQIKREMEEGGTQVRIMTVHGSKGLQAPIVIMPDTIEKSGGKEGLLLWPDKTALNVPVWTPRKEDAAQGFRDILARCKGQNDEEKYRLLYVAMTRAADRLYIGGYLSPRMKKDGSWFEQIENAMRRMDGVQVLEDGTLRYAVTQQGEIDKKKKASGVQGGQEPPEQWAFKTVPPEPAQPRPLRPSRLEDSEKPVSVLSPLKADKDQRFLRGNLTHKLLQFLPDFPPENRADAAQKFIDKNGRELKEDAQRGIVEEVMRILESADFAPFFAANALAEVPVTAMMDGGRIISGQIDRLVVGADKIWILDYKTNRPPPQRVEDVPKIYVQQMQAYRETIAKLYPSREIICGLLWTDGPRLMIL